MDGRIDGVSFISCHFPPHSPPSNQTHWPCTSSTYPASSHLRAFVLCIPSAWTPLPPMPSSTPLASSYLPVDVGWVVTPQAAFLDLLSWNKSHSLNPLWMYLSPSTIGDWLVCLLFTCLF